MSSYSLADLAPARPFWYLATVYSKHSAGVDEAAFQAATIAADLLRAGVSVFSPVAHSHTIADCGDINPLDHEFWLAADRPFVDVAHGMIIANMRGWQESAGIAQEIAWFNEAIKPIFLLNVVMMTVEKLR